MACVINNINHQLNLMLGDYDLYHVCSRFLHLFPYFV